MVFAIRRKSDGMYYHCLNWRPLNKARLFKQKGHVTSFLNSNEKPFYLVTGSTETKFGLIYFKDNIKFVASPSEYEVVEFELTEVKS